VWGGVPEKHHTLRADGKIELLDEWQSTDKQNQLGMKFLLMNMRVTPRMQQLSYGADLPKIMDFQEENYNVGPPLPVPGYRSEAWDEYGADVSTIQDEFMWQAVVGQIDIDAEWDNYVATWMRAGGEEVIEEAQAAYDAR
jgi:hypothetical protein